MIFEEGLIIYTGSGTPPFFKNSGKCSLKFVLQLMFILTVHVYTDCRTIAMLKADLSRVPVSDFDIANSGNGDWYKVYYDIEMSFEATLSFRLVFKGTVLSAPDWCKYTTTKSSAGKVLGECGVDYGR